MDRRTMITALALVLGSSSISFSLVQDSTHGTKNPGALQQLDKDFNIPAGKRLDLQLQTGGSVNITGWDKDVVSIRLRVGGRDWQDCRFEAKETPSALQIISRYQGDRKSYSTSLHFDIKVPKRFDVEIQSSGGEIRITDVAGDIRGKTMGGNLVLRGIGGELSLTTMGGDINLTSSQVNGEAETMSGEVLIQDVIGNIHGSTMSGRVKYINVTNLHGTAIR
ncbi:MAG: hypothetical protein LC803_22255 [Acidobacteria bacterium]|nr:hypothetical protein [Acidobacteriota bacterium]